MEMSKPLKQGKLTAFLEDLKKMFLKKT